VRAGANSRQALLYAVLIRRLARNGVAFNDLGPDYFDRMNTTKLKRYHLRRLAELGCDVRNLIPAA
jgi:hypothetical protein